MPRKRKDVPFPVQARFFVWQTARRTGHPPDPKGPAATSKYPPEDARYTNWLLAQIGSPSYDLGTRYLNGGVAFPGKRRQNLRDALGECRVQLNRRDAAGVTDAQRAEAQRKLSHLEWELDVVCGLDPQAGHMCLEEWDRSDERPGLWLKFGSMLSPGTPTRLSPTGGVSSPETTGTPISAAGNAPHLQRIAAKLKQPECSAFLQALARECELESGDATRPTQRPANPLQVVGALRTRPEVLGDRLAAFVAVTAAMDELETPRSLLDSPIAVAMLEAADLVFGICIADYVVAESPKLDAAKQRMLHVRAADAISAVAMLDAGIGQVPHFLRAQPDVARRGEPSGIAIRDVLSTQSGMPGLLPGRSVQEAKRNIDVLSRPHFDIVAAGDAPADLVLQSRLQVMASKTGRRVRAVVDLSKPAADRALAIVKTIVGDLGIYAVTFGKDESTDKDCVQAGRPHDDLTNLVAVIEMYLTSREKLEQRANTNDHRTAP
jgi:hypothetical protein